MSDFVHPMVNASWETRGYWEGAGRGELVLQRCAACSCQWSISSGLTRNVAG